MVLILGLAVLLVPLMRFKDYQKSKGATIKDSWLLVKGFNLNTLKGVSLLQVKKYLKELVKSSNSNVSFTEFPIDDSPEQSLVYDLMERYLGLVWE